MDRFQTPVRPLAPAVSVGLRAAVRAARERQVGLIPPPAVADNARTLPGLLGRVLGGNPAPTPDEFLLEHEEVSPATRLAFQGSGRLPTDADERDCAASVQVRVDDFRRSWVQAVRGGEVAARFEALNHLGEAWNGLYSIRGAVPDARRHLDSLQRAALHLRPVQEALTAGMRAILSGQEDDALYGSDALRLGLSARTRVPEVLRDLAQRCRDAAEVDSRLLPVRLRIEVQFESVTRPADIALVLDEVARALETGESLRLATGLVGDVCSLLRPCALRSYLEDLRNKGEAAQRRLFDEGEDNGPELMFLVLT